jgi:hypothetical protein
LVAEQYCPVESNGLTMLGGAGGVSATFNAAVASDGKGMEQYAINLVTCVRKEGDKALVLICQNHIAALKTHGDAMESMLKSSKVR